MRKMNHQYKHISFTSLLVFLLVSCAPSLSPSAYPNPVTATATPTLTAVKLIPRTLTPTDLPPVPPSQDFGKGNLAEMGLDEVQNLSEEEIAKLLVSKWLESYKTDKSIPEAIDDYSVEKADIRSHPSDIEVIVTVQFSVVPVRYSANWVSMSIKAINSNDSWWYISGTFSVFQEEGNYKLKLLPGWGT
jgi:hypothetical protein